MEKEELLILFQELGAMLKGHFQLSSGKHSPTYMQNALILCHPRYASMLGQGLAQKIKDLQIDLVISPALGGVIIGHELARALGKPAFFCERVNNIMTLRRGFHIKPKQNIFLVEDVVTTGGSLEEVAKVVEAEGGQVVGYGAVVDRTGISPFKGSRFEALLKIDLDIYDSQDCPLCKENIPVMRPGTHKK